jgi:Holliday junction resolvase RusA-like endonuclease
MTGASTAAPDAATLNDRWSSFDIRWSIEREKAVRKGTIPPRDAQERAQAAEGEVEASQLDAVRARTVISLPFPPSINKLYRAVAGRSILSREYRAWKDEAGLLLASQRPLKVSGPVSVVVELVPPDKRRRDADNAGTKAVLDLLVAHGVIEADDSRILKSITARWVESGEPCTVTIEASP